MPQPPAPRFEPRRKTASEYPREMWAVVFADSGEVFALTGSTDDPDTRAKAYALSAILNRADCRALNQARRHA